MICFLIHVKVSSSKYYAELAIFNRSLQIDIFDKRDWEKLDIYFSEPIFQEINDRLISRTLD